MALLLTAVLLYQVVQKTSSDKTDEFAFSRFLEEVQKEPTGVKEVTISDTEIRGVLTSGRNFKTVLPMEYPELINMTVTPAVVEVQGPASKVELLESVPTAIVRVSGRNASFAESIDLDLPDPMVRLQLLSPVEVRINIKERGSK